MRGAVCILLSFMLLFTLSAFEAPKNVQTTAWWGLLFPQMFAQPDGSEQVTFTWPLFEMVIRALRVSG